MTREFTGRHAAIIFVSAFTVIIGVNLTLAYSAVNTFPGVEVKNSYVASQTFDTRRHAQQALGWTVTAKETGGLLILSITDETGTPITVQSMQAVLGRATHVQEDQSPEFTFDGTAYVAKAALNAGNWNIRLTAIALDGTPFEQRVPFVVKG